MDVLADIEYNTQKCYFTSFSQVEQPPGSPAWLEGEGEAKRFQLVEICNMLDTIQSYALVL